MAFGLFYVTESSVLGAVGVPHVFRHFIIIIITIIIIIIIVIVIVITIIIYYYWFLQFLHVS